MSNFVNKVYDRYLTEDWSFGQDNLNPMREISMAEKDETIEQLISSVKDKVSEIDSRYAEVETPLTAVFNTGEKFEGDPTCLLNAKARAGGSVLLIPSFANEEDALVDEVSRLILKLSAIAEVDDLFGSLDCNGNFDLITGELIDTDEDKLNNELMDDSSDGNFDGNSNNNGDSSNSGDGNSDSNNGESDDGKVDVSNKDKDESDTQTQIAQNDLVDDISDNNKATENSVKECAKADLAILKVILTILKVISTIKKILNPTLNITVEIVEIITMVCSIRVNPPVIAEIIQKIINKIIAVLCMIISMLLQMLWDLLGLDCITEESMDLLDQIREALAGVNSIFAEIDSTAVSFATGIEEAIDSVALAEQAVQNAVQAIPSWNSIKEAFDVKGAIVGVGEDWRKNYKSYGEAAKNQILAEFNLQDKIGAAQSKIDEIGAQWKTIQGTAAKMAGANSGVQRLMSSFQNVTSL